MTDVVQDESQIVTDAIELGEKVKEKIVSDPDAVRKIISGAVPVEDYVTIYPDKALNLRFQKHTQTLADVAARAVNDPTGEVSKALKVELDALEAEAKELKSALEASAVTLRFVGLGKKAVKRIRNEVFEKYPFPPAGIEDDQALASDRQDAYEEWLIAAHLADSGYTREDISDWRDTLPLIEFGKLWAMAQKLSITDDYLQGAFNVDF